MCVVRKASLARKVCIENNSCNRLLTQGNSNMVLDLKKKTFLLITGASRGIGASIATTLAPKLAAGSVLVLLARHNGNLQSTALSIEKSVTNVKVLTFPIDLSQAGIEQYRTILNDSFSAVSELPSNFERAFLIHNAGTVGDISKRAIEATDANEWEQYFKMNFFSIITLNAEFLKFFPSNTHKLVVNISSKCAIEPFVSMSFYCTGKAARDMFFRVLAAEQSDVLVLNYAPGAIDTDMTVLLQQQTFDATLAELFKTQREEKTLLTTTQTANRFVFILENMNFKSGDHIDYWDATA